MKIIAILIIILSYSYFPTVLGKYRWKDGFITEDKEIMLTFDDGPDENYTEELLNLLLKEEIRASFFVVSEYAKENSYLIDRMIREGHTLGVHSSNHRPILYRGYRYTKEDFEKSIEDMRSLGIDLKYYRPPWGQVNIFSYLLLKKYNIKKILWNVMAEDWESGSTVYQIEDRLYNRVRKGSIICLHDGRGEDEAPRRTIDALENVIPRLKNEGYSFITVGEYYG